MMRYCVVAALSVVLGCGSHGSGEPCTVTDNGGSATITCPDGTSATIQDGADGSPGPQGAAGASGINGADGASGADGQDGSDGIDNHIVASHFCQGSLEGTALFFTYHAALTSYGDLFVNASIRDAEIEVGGSTFYAAGQNGATLATVIFEYDNASPPDGGLWEISLDRSTLITTIQYVDVDVTGGELGWTMTPDACISTAF